MTNRSRKLLAWPLGLLLCVCCSVHARGSIVATLEVQPGTFSLYLQDDLAGDTAGTFGIALYGVPLNGGILTLDHKSPVGNVLDGLNVYPIGFNNFRSLDGSTQISASQTIAPVPTPYPVPNFGRAAGDLKTFIGPATLFTSEQPVYDAKLLIASGTWLGVAPTIDASSVDFVVSVFSDNNLTSTQAATIRVNAVPEPNAIGLVLLGGIGFFIRRRVRPDLATRINNS